MTYTKPNSVNEIEDLSTNEKNIKTLEIIEIILIALMVIDLLGRAINYVTVHKANRIHMENITISLHIWREHKPSLTGAERVPVPGAEQGSVVQPRCQGMNQHDRPCNILKLRVVVNLGSC